jgi:hypothetical protein
MSKYTEMIVDEEKIRPEHGLVWIRIGRTHQIEIDGVGHIGEHHEKIKYGNSQ